MEPTIDDTDFKIVSMKGTLVRSFGLWMDRVPPCHDKVQTFNHDQGRPFELLLNS